MRAGAWPGIAISAALLAALGCSDASSGGGGAAAGGKGQGGSLHVGGSGGGGGISVGGGSGSGGGTSTGCSEESKFVYVLDKVAMLYKFDPPSLVFTPIGTLNCPNSFA